MARDFDGSDDHVAVSDIALYEFTTSESYTWTCWVRHDSLTGYQDYIRKDLSADSPRGLYILRKVTTSNVIEYLAGTVGTDLQTNVVGTTALSANTWYFVAVVRDVGADQFRLYLATASGDVTQEIAVTDTTTTTHGQGTAALEFGRAEGNLEVMNGRLAEFTLWNRALSVNELRAAKQGRYYELTGKEGHWPLWGVASPEPDLSRNKNNGTVTGAVLAPHAPVAPYAPYTADDYWAALVTAAGTAHTATVTDSLGLTDGEIATYADARFTYADSILDYLGHVQQEVFVSLGHPHTDALGLTDSVSVAVSGGTNYQVTVTDALGLTDSVAQAVASKRDQMDALGLADSLVLELGKVLTDALGLSDSVTWQVTYKRQPTDALGITDSVVVNLSGVGNARTFTDPLGITDQVLRAVTIHVTVTDSLGLSDTASRKQGVFLTESLGLADSVSRVATIHLTVTDIEGLTDFPVALANIQPVPLALEGIHDPTLALTGRHTPTKALEGKHTPDADLVGSSGLTSTP